ncbi:helix-turn-helix transcriptional regulator [Pelosinus sp. IPA-1]|uniref:helix-turn-helix transcriptional regulator n=1 Tax=Pelosinus sp. IPA-1 TaxID=3029569 RepID=UPI002436222D|nr:helix-turn-helix transcriptional regulator [Pelosinus sp. IPA-1]GMB02032.1 transcriptional regulator [Pelosinus sp. IPA-1]
MEGEYIIQLTMRQTHILEIIQSLGPITGNQIAEKLNLSRAALRSDLAILTMSKLIGAKPKVGYYFIGQDLQKLKTMSFDTILVGDAHSLPIVVKENSSVYDAIVTLFIEDVGTIFVVSEGNFLEGAISRKDLLKAAMGGKNNNELPVSIIMTRMPKIILTTPEESVLSAAQKLLYHQVDALPVVKAVKEGENTKFQVVGRFTKTNIARLFVQLAES